MLVLGRERERAGFLDWPVDDRGISGPRQCAVGAAGDRDERTGEFLQRAEQPQEFFRFAAVRKQQRDIIGVNAAEVAVNGRGWRRVCRERVPVELNVPTVFCPTSADLPTPITATRPRQRKRASATARKPSSSRLATTSSEAASARSTRRVSELIER